MAVAVAGQRATVAMNLHVVHENRDLQFVDSFAVGCSQSNKVESQPIAVLAN